MPHTDPARSYSDILQDWSASQDLVDVAPRGTARQSSLSRWSSPDDASQALRRSGRNFAFHTDVERRPWWEVDLGHSYPISVLFIENRRAPHHTPHHRIRIDVSTDSETWQEVHRGFLAFGSDVHGLPLSVSFDGRILARFIRITLIGKGALHLRHVSVLVSRQAASDPSLGKLFFVATRSDGLCQRMLAILNAGILARAFDGAFGFLWLDKTYDGAEAQAVDDMTQIFAANFIEAHHIEEGLNHTATPIYPRRQHSAAELHQILEDGRKTGYIRVHQADPLATTFPSLAGDLAPDAYAQAFAAVAFSAPIQAAIDYARSIAMPDDATVIHVRGGDIVHGTYSYNSIFTHKALSFLEVGDLLSDLPAAAPVYLIGQEADIIAYYCRHRPNTFSIGDLAERERFSAHQRVFFDVVVMSRAKTLICADSAVSQLAIAIGSAEHRDVSSMTFPASGDIPDLALPAFDDISKAQKGYSLLKRALPLLAARQWQEALPLTGAMVRFSPDNTYYRCLHGTALHGAGQQDAADAQFRAALMSTSSEWGNTLVTLAGMRLQHRNCYDDFMVDAFRPDTGPGPHTTFVTRFVEAARSTPRGGPGQPSHLSGEAPRLLREAIETLRTQNLWAPLPEAIIHEATRMAQVMPSPPIPPAAGH